ncbi:MAG: aminoacyl-tRNA hydrolase [Candidatus Margulisiibacteriota bacterium]
MYLVVGLGNPGKEYQNTRHNMGFMAIDSLTKDLMVSSFKSKCQAFIAEAKIEEHKIILVQPQTFMNNSGQAVQELLSWYKIDPKKLVVIYDDVDLDVGQIRLREKGGAGGHHGIESIIQFLGTTEFIRVRIGIGREGITGDVAGYVLQAIPSFQREMLNTAINRAAEAAKSIVQRGISVAMNEFNKV